MIQAFHTFFSAVFETTCRIWFTLSGLCDIVSAVASDAAKFIISSAILDLAMPFTLLKRFKTFQTDILLLPLASHNDIFETCVIDERMERRTLLTNFSIQCGIFNTTFYALLALTISEHKVSRAIQTGPCLIIFLNAAHNGNIRTCFFGGSCALRTSNTVLIQIFF